MTFLGREQQTLTTYSTSHNVMDISRKRATDINNIQY